MKNIIYLFAAALVACCLAGCQKAEKEVFVDNAMVVKPADGGETLVQSLGSVFTMGSLYVDPQTGRRGNAVNYRFFGEAYSQYPLGDGNPIIVVSGVKFDDTEYVEPADWISRISVRGLDKSKGQALCDISIAHGKYNGGNDSIKDARVDSFQNSDIRIVITTVDNEVVTISYSGKILQSGLL